MGSCGWGVFVLFSEGNNDYDDYDGTRILRIQRIIRIRENARIRCPDCGTREGSYPSESVSSVVSFKPTLWVVLASEPAAPTVFQFCVCSWTPRRLPMWTGVSCNKEQPRPAAPSTTPQAKASCRFIVLSRLEKYICLAAEKEESLKSIA